jgi:UDP-N-acetyl-D-mannosaminuronate dehydrogenase
LARVASGYVGLPLAVKSAEAGFPTIVYDNDRFKIQKIEKGELHIPDICPEYLFGRFRNIYEQRNSTRITRI